MTDITASDAQYFRLTWRPDSLAGSIGNLTRFHSTTPLPTLNPQQLVTTIAAGGPLVRHATQQCPQALVPPPPQNMAGAIYPPMKKPADWYCLDHADSGDPNEAPVGPDRHLPGWSLQGISGSEDTARGIPHTIAGHKVFLLSWYHNDAAGHNDGSRLTFLLQDPQNARGNYQHVGLVQLSGSKTNPTFRPLRTHADGVVWYRDATTDRLFVADPDRGLLAFDMNKILDLGSTVDPRAPGFRYVLPEVGVWGTRGGPCNRTLTAGETGFVPRPHVPCYNYASLDTSVTSYQFVTGEYCRLRIHDQPSWCPSRLARWRISDIQNWTPNTTIEAVQVFTQPATSVQGAASYNFSGGPSVCYYFNSSRGRNNLGWVFADRPDITAAPQYEHGGVGLQDLYVESDERQLWTVTEWPGYGKRILYGIAPPPPLCP
ncbi:hypothetical protein FNH05_28290 [Amycolatopsis rhizosphaerae]|uniref:DUF946 domain-containing protein n=1 Tax=Amycolatopsis rhizosphaerae TaxID=2053003 RepID=A0A558B4R5_9PSEU|nr:hypothetical protein [Amycolatopsis rhizosphaerae]TVT31499.1 hypothetical protein FNH05_28290 [Amycolatopsis rhizosphaerae]